jgi:predicted RNA-binding protein associated with RNAse of E/G family
MSDTFTVKLPAEMKPFLVAEAKEHGFKSVAHYLAVLARANGPVEVEDNPELEAALLEGINSGEPIVADEAFWKDMRRRVRAATKARTKRRSA